MHTNFVCALMSLFLDLVISGAVEHGNHFTLNLVYEHILDRTSYSFTYGPFGGVKGIECQY